MDNLVSHKVVAVPEECVASLAFDGLQTLPT